MSDPSPPNVPAPAPQFRIMALSHRKPTRFAWAPDGPARAALARELDLIRIPFLRITGEIRPDGRDDFRLEARLEAEVAQACVVTLAPVPARVDEPVTRRFLADFVTPEGDEVEMPEDDTVEALPPVIDIAAITAEALMLALPPYPRADGASLGEAVYAEPGVAALRDDDLRPFAALARLKPKDETEG